MAKKVTSKPIPTSDLPKERARLQAATMAEHDIHDRYEALARLREFDRSVKGVKVPKPATDVHLATPKRKIKDRPQDDYWFRSKPIA